MDYLLNQAKMTRKVADKTCVQLSAHPDVFEEFTRRVVRSEAGSGHGQDISVEGYTARMLMDTTYLTPVGAYNFLVFLREEPEAALADLKRGLPRK